MLIQAAGHGLLRLSTTHPNAVVKPTTAVEAEMYQRLGSDARLDPLRRFVPRLIRVSPLSSLDPLHPTHSHEVEIENLCLLGVKNWDDSAATVGRSSDDEPVHPNPQAMRVDSDEGGAEAFPVEQASFDDPQKAAELFPPATHTPESITGPTRTEWSDPCVLDIKLGRIRHGPNTKPEKVARILKKDAGTTGPTLGLRICGLRHEHRGIDVNSLLTRNGHDDHVVVRVDSATGALCEAKDDADEDDEHEHRSALCDYATMRSQRGDRSGTGSLLSRTHTPLAGCEPILVTALDDPVRRRRRMRAALGQRMEWVEGKELGRNVDRDGFIEAIAKYCTCVELRGEDKLTGKVDGEHPVPETSRSSSVGDDAQEEATRASGADAKNRQHFTPQPHIPLVQAYRREAIELRDALVNSNILEHYSFASTSVICVHDFHIDVTPASELPQTPSGAHPWSSSTKVRFRSQLRLVDFSSSGLLAEGCVFPDAMVGCVDGLNNLIEIFDQVIHKYSPCVAC